LVPVEKPFKLQVIGPTHPLAPAARALVGAVFLEEFGNTEEVMHEEYDRYDPATRYIVMTDRRGKVVGTIGVIDDNPAGFKSVNDLSGPPWNVPPDEITANNPAFVAAYEGRKTLDAATGAVDPPYRRANNPTGPQVSLGLLHGLCRVSVADDVECWVTIVEDTVLNHAIQPLGRPLTRYQDPRLGTREYLGAVSTPMYSDVIEYRHRLKRDHPDLHAILFEGQRIHDFADVELP
jgi:hypothetical protein